MMWAFALWAIGFLALVGAHLQDRKKEALLGDAWAAWEKKTSYWPRFARLGAIGPALWLAAIAIWLGVTYLHMVLAYVPAGIWR